MNNKIIKSNKRRALLLAFWAFLVLGICSLSSFAYIVLTVDVKDENVVSSGCLKLDLEEESPINLDATFPMTDDNGMNTEPYIVKVTNTCTLPAKFVMSLNLLDGSDVSDSNSIKIAVSGDLTINPKLISNLNSNNLNDFPKNIIYSYYLTDDIVEPSESRKYDIRLWIDQDATMLKSPFSAKVMLEAVVNED